MNEKTCAVAGCPALAAIGRKTCDPHRDARLAKELHVSEDSFGKGGKRCVECRRKFGPLDYVFMTPTTKTNRKKEIVQEYKHVACEPSSPRVSKKAIRESVKPLWEVDDDVERNRGAA